MTALEAIALAASRLPLAQGGVAVAWHGANGVCVAVAETAEVRGTVEAAAARDGVTVDVVRVDEMTETMETMR